MPTEIVKDNIRPKSYDTVKVKKTGHITEVRYSMNNTGGNIRKLDKDYYVIVETGEVKQFNHTNSRADNKISLALSLSRLRDIINTNVTESTKCKWVTLTYRENMRDHHQLYEDFRRFNSRFCYYLINAGLPKYEYIVAMEPQGRGSWHAHLILVFSVKAPFIPNDTLERIWGHGFTKTKSLSDVDNIGLYLSAYLGDMEFTDVLKNGRDIKNCSIKEIESPDTHEMKCYVKGARLHMYPPGFNIYRKSKGIKMPEVWDCTEAEAMREIGNDSLIYEKTIRVLDGKDVINIINYRQYNHKPRLPLSK